MKRLTMPKSYGITVLLRGIWHTAARSVLDPKLFFLDPALSLIPDPDSNPA
jgi:hypothetical protein